MKCPKCGYVSFDYNEVCPKCNKGITPERDKMKLPSYKPNPPSLLGTLTGKAKKTGGVDLMEAPGTSELLDRELDFATEDLDFKEEDILTTETTEPSLDDTYSFEVPLEEESEERSQESTETFEFSDSAEDIEEVELSSIESDEDLSVDIEEIAIEGSELQPSLEPLTEDEIVFDSDLVAIEDEDTETTSASELPSLDEETGSIALDELIEAEPDIELEEQEAEASFDLDKTISFDLEDLPQVEPEISLEEEPESEGGREKELLSLEDLKDEEIESIVSKSEVSSDDISIDQELDLALDEDALSTDEIPIPAEIPGSSEDFSIDLDSLDLDLELEEPDDK
jgi:hypothetical protein